MDRFYSWQQCSDFAQTYFVWRRSV